MTGFDAHIQLISFKANDSYDLDPIPVTDSLLSAIGGHLTRRAGADCKIGAGMFTNRRGVLGMTREGEEILSEWK